MGGPDVVVVCRLFSAVVGGTDVDKTAETDAEPAEEDDDDVDCVVEILDDVKLDVKMVDDVSDNNDEVDSVE